MMVFICKFVQPVQTCLALNLYLSGSNQSSTINQVAIFKQSSSFYQSHSEIIYEFFECMPRLFKVRQSKLQILCLVTNNKTFLM